MTALVEFVVVDKIGISPLRSTPRAQIDLVRKDANGNRDGDAFDTEIGERVFPVETGSGKRRVRQPGDRDVVEDIVLRKALGLTVKDA